jgi:hypothetical protein
MARPALLAAVATATWPPHSPSLALRLVSKACCQAVDATPTRIRLDFDQARQQDPDPEARLARMERRLAKLPRLEELACSFPSDTDLVLARPVAAGVQRLQQVPGCSSGRSDPSDPDEPGPSPAALPSPQVRDWLPCRGHLAGDCPPWCPGSPSPTRIEGARA